MAELIQLDSEEFTKIAMPLVIKSQHVERIENLMEIPDYGVHHESNCHGTSLYVLDLIAQPKYYGPKKMEKKLLSKDFFFDPIYEGCLVSFWTKNERLSHSAIYLGNIDDKKIVFHQTN